MTALKVTRRPHVAGNVAIEDLGLTLTGAFVAEILDTAKVQRSLTSGSLRRLLDLTVITVSAAPIDEGVASQPEPKRPAPVKEPTLIFPAPQGRGFEEKPPATRAGESFTPGPTVKDKKKR